MLALQICQDAITDNNERPGVLHLLNSRFNVKMVFPFVFLADCLLHKAMSMEAQLNVPNISNVTIRYQIGLGVNEKHDIVSKLIFKSTLKTS